MLCYSIYGVSVNMPLETSLSPSLKMDHVRVVLAVVRANCLMMQPPTSHSYFSSATGILMRRPAPGSGPRSNHPAERLLEVATQSGSSGRRSVCFCVSIRYTADSVACVARLCSNNSAGLPSNALIAVVAVVLQATAHDRLLKEFSCALCKNVLNQPLSMPCGHNFCKECLDKRFAEADASAQGSKALQEAKPARTLRIRKVGAPLSDDRCSSFQGLPAVYSLLNSELAECPIYKVLPVGVSASPCRCISKLFNS